MSWVSLLYAGIGAVCALGRHARIATAVALLGWSGRAAFGQVTWDGSCGTDNWHTCCNIPGGLVDNNWDVDPSPQCPPFPGPDDEVDLNGAAVQITVQPVQIRNVSNGSLTVTVSGRLTTTEFVNLGSLTVFTDVTAGGDIIINGPLNWRGGTLAAPMGSVPADMRVGANGPIAIDWITNSILDRRTLVANAPASWTGSGDIVLNNGSVFDNRVSLSTNRDERIGGNNGTFLNKAPFSKGDSTGVTRIQSGVFFDNSDLGAIDIATGTLQLDGGGQNRGAIHVNTDATLRFNTVASRVFTIKENTDVQGGGLVEFAGGTFVVETAKHFSAANALISGPATLSGPGDYQFGDLTWFRGTLTGGGVTTVSGSCALRGNLSRTIDAHTLDLRGSSTWEGGNFVETQIFNGATLNNFGEFAIRNEPGKRVRFVNGQWINHPGSTLDVLTDLSFIVGPGLFQNQGRLNIGPGVSLIPATPVQFEQLGILNLHSGTLRVSAGRANGAQFNLDPGTVMEIQSLPFVIEDNTQFTGLGKVLIPGIGGAALDFQAPDRTEIPNVELAGGTLTGPGTVAVTNQLDWTSGQMTGAGTTISGTRLNISDDLKSKSISQRALINEGLTVWTGGDIFLNDNATFTNAAGAELEVQTSADFGHSTGESSAVFNEGVLRKRVLPGDLTFPAGVEFYNPGSVILNESNIELAGGGLSAGTFDIVQGSEVIFKSFYILDTGARIIGGGKGRLESDTLRILGADVEAQNFEMSGGVLDGAGTLKTTQSLLWDQGAMAGAGTTRSEGQLQMVGTGAKLISGRTLISAGPASITQPLTVRLDHGARLVNEMGATFSIVNPSSGTSVRFEHLLGDPGTFENGGGFVCQGVDTIVDFLPGVAFNHSGQVEVGDRVG
ncbi:MAG: hypothetical protein HY718_21085, partial [Planctomycetes bacterium]|nr:hypothetical protein [Planctomycetota bacterium]